MTLKRTTPLTLKEIDRINQGSIYSSSIVATKIAKALIIAKDGEKEARLATKLCSGCYYLGNIFAGQAFTAWKCYFCGINDMHPNTATPQACSTCSDSFEICRQCLGTLDMSRKSVYARKARKLK